MRAERGMLAAGQGASMPGLKHGNVYSRNRFGHCHQMISNHSPMINILSLACTSAPFLSATAMAQAVAVQEPSTPWKVDYAENECRLLRTFGSGADAVTMRLARGSGFDSFDFILAGPSVPKLPKQLTVNFALEPQGKAQDVEAYSLGVPGRSERFIRWYDANPELLPFVGDDQIVAIRHMDRFAISLRWTDGKAALAALETCHLDLLKSWGVDIVALKSAKVRAQPVGSPGRWATNSDYPSVAQREGKQGTVVFQLEISPEGRTVRCVVVQSSLVPELDAATCRLMLSRAKFTPALDASDRPITGFYVNRVRWQIP